MKTVIKAIARKIMPAAFILAVVFLLAPVGAQAAKKPGQVTKLEEVKATNTSITVRFKKVKGAKKYQVRVYEAKLKWKTRKWGATSKKLVKEVEAKKTTCTIKGLSRQKGYAIKVRAYNGKSYGKWTTLKTLAGYNSDGVKLPGTTAATGKYLEKQYNLYKKYILKEMKESFGVYGVLGVADDVKCTEEVRGDRKDYASYSKDDLLRTYKNGTGSNLEIYHMMADMCKSAGVKCAIKQRVYNHVPMGEYDFLIWDGDKIYSESIGKGKSMGSDLHPEDLENYYE